MPEPCSLFQLEHFSISAINLAQPSAAEPPGPTPPASIQTLNHLSLSLSFALSNTFKNQKTQGRKREARSTTHALRWTTGTEPSVSLHPWEAFPSETSFCRPHVLDFFLLGSAQRNLLTYHPQPHYCKQFPSKDFFTIFSPTYS